MCVCVRACVLVCTRKSVYVPVCLRLCVCVKIYESQTVTLRPTMYIFQVYFLRDSSP